jgi:acyl transferase domain-containing protein
LRQYGNKELLGAPSREWNPLLPQWRCVVRTSDMPWLLDHKLNGKAIYPASSLVCMAIEGATQLASRDREIAGFTLRHVRYKSAITVPVDGVDLETTLQFRPVKSSSPLDRSIWSFVVHSVQAEHWSESCHGTIELSYVSPSSTESVLQKSWHYKDHFRAHEKSCNLPFDPVTIYDNFTRHGFQYGPTFQAITSLRHDGEKELKQTLA